MKIFYSKFGLLNFYQKWQDDLEHYLGYLYFR